MSLAFDENGRPFIILREQEKKKRVKGLEAHKVRSWKRNGMSLARSVEEGTFSFFLEIVLLIAWIFPSDQYHGSEDCCQPNEDLSWTQRHGQNACQVSQSRECKQVSNRTLYSPDGDVIVTNDGATILEKMEVNKSFHLTVWIIRFITKLQSFLLNFQHPRTTRLVMEPLVSSC